MPQAPITGLEKIESIYKDFGLSLMCSFIYLHGSQMNRQHRLKGPTEIIFFMKFRSLLCQIHNFFLVCHKLS